MRRQKQFMGVSSLTAAYTYHAVLCIIDGTVYYYTRSGYKVVTSVFENWGLRTQKRRDSALDATGSRILPVTELIARQMVEVSSD